MCKVSVVMCVYNNEKYIREAIESFSNIPMQDIEIIVIDDNSKDHTFQIASEYANRDSRIKLFKNKVNLGIPRNAKRGIENCTGELIFFAGGDDISFPDRIEKGIEIFRNNPNVGVIVGNCEIIDEQSNSTGEYYVIPERITNENIIINQFKRNYCLGACMAIRKDKSILMQNHVLELIDDYQISLEYILKGYEIFIDRNLLVKYRIHDSNVSNNRSALYQKTVKALQYYNSDEIMTFLMSKKYSRKEVLTSIGIFELFRGNVDKGFEYLYSVKDETCTDKYLDYENLFYLGVAYYKKGQYMKSFDCFLRAKEKNPFDATVFNNIGVLNLLVNKDYSTSYQMFLKAIAIQPNYLDCSRNIELLETNKNLYKELKLTERIIEHQIIKRKRYILEDK
ncbi:glycosyltransferase [Thermaerobacillus caldiproteolyticus]|uniref:glycosyltransferase n=1 Tax=Thermaerobacillus caldiproteolyticus TaxID=247480 RepID=UPI00188D810F|nr:glycosyltransferase [Anoxybacillus caldiproteolyticus]QPA30697.1 glycosyltransferase [Anoxybacillus caldiproteolyticus]